MSGTLTDGGGRRITHLRLSVTESCDVRCRYCVEDRAEQPAHRIDPELALALVSWLSRRHGIRHLRLTGGEPLVHPGLVSLVGRLRNETDLAEIALTTNGQRLAAMAVELREAGLDRVNVSLDTLDAERFEVLTSVGRLDRTLSGIEAAIAADLTPVRLNAVVQRGVNDDEIGDLAAWGLTRGCEMRFLEAMPIGPLASRHGDLLVPAAQVLERLGERFTLRACEGEPGRPATDFEAEGEGLRGVVGVVASTSRPFCDRCRRIRITARGALLGCLFDRRGTDLTAAWDGRTLDESHADDLLLAAVASKSDVRCDSQETPMSRIGG